MKPTYCLSGGTFDREAGTRDTKRLFFLSVEGASTEPSYFRQLDAHLKGLGCGDAAIVVLGRFDAGRSAPEDVYSLLEECRQLREDEHWLPETARERLQQQFSSDELSRLLDGGKEMPRRRRQQFKELLLRMGLNLDYRKYIKAQPSEKDRFVVVLDRDRHNHTKKCLQGIVAKCRKNAFLCCLTNPCFEFWLLLHLMDADALSSIEESLLENKKGPGPHSYVGKLVSDIAHHKKKISPGKFKAFYKAKLQKARTAATHFATQNQDVLDKVGTTIPDLMDELFGPMP